MAEEFSIALAPGGPDDQDNLSEYRTQIILERSLERMTKWRQAAASVMTPALDFFAQSTTKHMYDLILITDHNVDEFRPLVFEVLVARAQRAMGTSPPTKFRMDVTYACLVSVHSCLDSFLKFSPDFVRSLPVLFYVEIGYTIGLLLKLSFVSVFLSRVLDRSTIKFGDYADRVSAFLGIVSERNKRHPTERLRLIMIGLRNWAGSHEQKIVELSSQIPKSPVQAFERPAPPVPTQQAYPTSHLMPPRSGVDVGLPFVGYADTGRGEVGDGEAQEMEGDPMLWDNFPLTEFLQLDGVADLYAPWG